MTKPTRQLDKDGRLRHLLTLEGLPATVYHELFTLAATYIDPATRRILKTPRLQDRLVVNAFFEPSTRTRLAFEIAAKSLYAEVVNFDMATSSVTAKGETFADTIMTIVALGADIVIVRHGQEGMVAAVADQVPERVALINGGDGCNAHPSQGLLDAWTIMQHKGDVQGLRIAIIGDIIHSRVARSLLDAFTTLQAAEVIVAGPPALVPVELTRAGVTVEHDLTKAVAGVDVIIGLRFQFERMASQEPPPRQSPECMIDAALVARAAPDVMVMHPGPINRGLEISSEVADGPRSYILEQVTNGVAMRMAIMTLLTAD